MTVKLLTEHHLEFLSLKGGCPGSSEYIHVKMPHCWKSHVAAQMLDRLNSGYSFMLTLRKLTCFNINLSNASSVKSCGSYTSMFPDSDRRPNWVGYMDQQRTKFAAGKK